MTSRKDALKEIMNVWKPLRQQYLQKRQNESTISASEELNCAIQSAVIAFYDDKMGLSRAVPLDTAALHLKGVSFCRLANAIRALAEVRNVNLEQNGVRSHFRPRNTNSVATSVATSGCGCSWGENR